VGVTIFSTKKRKKTTTKKDKGRIARKRGEWKKALSRSMIKRKRSHGRAGFSSLRVRRRKNLLFEEDAKRGRGLAQN